MGLDTQLAQLESAQLVRRLAEAEPTFLFKHALTQEAAYDSLLVKTRREIHLRVARSIEELYADRLDENAALLAYHFELAQVPDKALVYLQRAAEWARHSAAHREELALLDRALTLAERLGQKEVLADLHARRGWAFASITLWPEAMRELELALSMLPEGQLERRAQMLGQRAIVAGWLRELEIALSSAQEALRLAEQIGRDDLAASAMSTLAAVEAFEGQVRASVVHFDAAQARAGGIHNASFLQGMEMASLATYWLGDYDSALERNRETVRLAREMSDTVTLVRGLSNMGLALMGRGQYSQALEILHQAREFGQEHEGGAWLARTVAIEGGLHLELYDYAGAEALAHEAQHLAVESNFLVALVSPGIDLLFSFARSGRLGQAEKIEFQVRQALPSVRGLHVWLLALRFAQACAELALARGQWDRALELSQESLAVSRTRGRPKYQALALETRARALVAVGDAGTAKDCLRQALELARQVGDPAMFLRPACALLRLDGDDALARDARREARRISDSLPPGELKSRFEAIVSEWV